MLHFHSSGLSILLPGHSSPQYQLPLSAVDACIAVSPSFLGMLSVSPAAYSATAPLHSQAQVKHHLLQEALLGHASIHRDGLFPSSLGAPLEPHSLSCCALPGFLCLSPP